MNRLLGSSRWFRPSSSKEGLPDETDSIRRSETPRTKSVSSSGTASPRSFFGRSRFSQGGRANSEPTPVMKRSATTFIFNAEAQKVVIIESLNDPDFDSAYFQQLNQKLQSFPHIAFDTFALARDLLSPEQNSLYEQILSSCPQYKINTLEGLNLFFEHFVDFITQQYGVSETSSLSSWDALRAFTEKATTQTAV